MITLTPFLNELTIITKERGEVRLGDVMNDSQRLLIEEVERQLNTNGKIRIITLKARQMGISTVIEGIIFTLSILHPSFQSLIISHEQESAEHILGMTKRYWSTYPFAQFHQEKYVSRKQLAWSDNNSNITVATAKNTNAGRSKTIHALHASEVAFWDHPDDLMLGLRQAIPNHGLSAIFIESTADGIGNYFHATWESAISGENEYTPLFFPWHQFPQYTAAYLDDDQAAKFLLEIKPLDEDELILRSMGVSDARLIWRRWAIVNLCKNDLNQFKQEYPATWHEAFLATGLNVFRKPDLDRHYAPFRPLTGYLERDHRNQVVFREHERGWLRVYRKPSPDKNWGVYQIGADPTHTSVGDYACAQVINRRTLEQCAVLQKKCNPMEFARELELLGEWYNVATIAPEKTGPGLGTVAYLVTRKYPALWEAKKLAKAPGQVNYDTWGWVTGRETKQMAVGYVVDAIGQHLTQVGNSTYGLVIHDEATYLEMVGYIRNEKGGFENGKGNDHDDTVMALAIALTTHLMDGPLIAYAADTGAHEANREVMDMVTEEMRRTMFAEGPTPPPAPGQVPEPSHQLVAAAPMIHSVTESDRIPAWMQEQGD